MLSAQSSSARPDAGRQRATVPGGMIATRPNAMSDASPARPPAM